MHTPKETNNETKTTRNIFSLASDVDVEEFVFSKKNFLLTIFYFPRFHKNVFDILSNYAVII